MTIDFNMIALIIGLLVIACFCAYLVKARLLSPKPVVHTPSTDPPTLVKSTLNGHSKDAIYQWRPPEYNGWLESYKSFQSRRKR